jgi:Rad3-related DNA helicase
MRNNQTHVLNEICEAFNSGYKCILLEAPTGFGKSPVAYYWIVYHIKKDDNFDDVSSVEFKMLDVSEYCKSVFDKYYKTLIMSATILNHNTFCRSVGLNHDDVKFIKLQQVKSNIVKTIDKIMTLHGQDKGIIHTTSYEQLNFIKENISENNAQRLVETNPNIERDEVIAHHVMSNSYNNNNNNKSPTVLIWPSLYTGIDLKDDLSRFQIIIKVKWIAAKMEKDKEWYYWQRALRLVQAYGRSIRSKQD